MVARKDGYINWYNQQEYLAHHNPGRFQVTDKGNTKEILENIKIAVQISGAIR